MSIGVGSEIAGYRILRGIGEGGMSLVYLAEHLADGEQAVLKVLREELARQDDFRRRFLRESGYAASLEHPNVVPVHGAGEAEGVLYIAMQYVHGTDLYGLLGGQPLEPELAVSILTQVAQALDAAHALGLLHRDVKPGNVLIAAEGDGDGPPHCYLADFGLGKHTATDSVALTEAGKFVGTVHYTAPEQIRGEDPTPAVDVYSLGCLLYECLVGEPPFAGLSEVEVMHAHIQSPPPRPSEKHGGLPVALDDIIAKAMAKEPDERYPSCGELMEAARSALGVVLPAVVEAAAPDIEEARVDKLRLKVTAGNASGSEIQVEDELLIGRQASDVGRLGDDIEISRQHARIARKGPDEFEIEDLGSTNGTLVNGRLITEPETLYPGDTIELGGTKLVVQVSGTTSLPPVGEEESEPTEVAAPEALGRLSLQIEVDFESGEALVRLDEQSDPVRLVHEDGRWHLAP